MAKPMDFGLDLATRIAMHEILLQRLFFEEIRTHSDPERSLEALKKSLLDSFDVSALRHGGEPLTEDQEEQVRQQSAYGKEISENFIKKVKRFI